jgi:8-oxo-dGTP diphosphatase
LNTLIVAAGIIVEGRRVLLTQRKTGSHLAGLWEFPGGKVEPGEDPRAALRRELLEELGIDALVGEVVDVAFHCYEEADDGKTSTAPAGRGQDSKPVLLLFFRATRAPASAEPRALDVAAFEWAGKNALRPARFPPADVAVLEKVRKLCED